MHMALDFWNNPLVISAFRTKNRYGALFTNLTLYFFLLAGLSVGAWYLLPGMFGRPVGANERLHFIFAGLLVFQTGLSALTALTATSAAMTSEINSGTLDYQRLTSLTPAQVLIGKMLGPPATSYLMILGAIPLTFVLWSLDATAMSLGTLLLLYFQQLTTALLCAAFGLVKRLPAGPAQKGGQQMSGVGCLLTILITLPLMSGMTLLPSLLSRQETAAVGLLLPVGPLTGLFQYDDPWHYGLSCFGIPLPFLLVTPLAQLALGSLCFVCMIRRLTNTVSLPLTKPMAYATLAVADVLAAAVLFEPALGNIGLGTRSTHYWLCHAVIVFFLTSYVTPHRRLLQSWIWRFRNRHSRLRDLFWEDRSENILVLLTFCAIGIGVYCLLVAMPALLAQGWDEAAGLEKSAIDSLIVACVLTLSLGTLSQAGKLLAGASGGIIFLFPFTCDLLAFVLGSYFRVHWLMSASVLGHWSTWATWPMWPPTEPLSLLPLFGWHSLIFFWSWMILRRRMSSETVKIERKLQQMKRDSVIRRMLRTGEYRYRSCCPPARCTRASKALT